jgi:hypothetical protein
VVVATPDGPHSFPNIVVEHDVKKSHIPRVESSEFRREIDRVQSHIRSMGGLRELGFTALTVCRKTPRRSGIVDRRVVALLP